MQYDLGADHSFTFGGTNYDLDECVYANVISFGHAVLQKLLDKDANSELYFDSSFRCNIVNGIGGSVPLIWRDTTVRDVLGFTSNFDDSKPYWQALYTPQYSWFPNMAPSNRDVWQIDQRAVFSGRRAHDGSICGLATGDSVYSRDYSFSAVPVALVNNSSCTNTRYQALTLETFLRGSRTATILAAGRPDPKGFYVVPDYEDVLTVSSTFGSGGVDFALSSSPDTYVFCAPDPGEDGAQRLFLPVGTGYWDVGFACRTCPAPTWGYP